LALQAVAEPVQEFAHERAPDLVPHVAQALAEFAQALAGPKQWRLRIAARVGLDEPAQIVDEAGVCRGQRLASAARTPHPINLACVPRAQFVQTASDRAARKTGDPRHHGYAAPSRSLRLGRRKTPQSALVQYRRERLEAQPNDRFVNHTKMLYDLDS
jgi:hypothetical protein